MSTAGQKRKLDGTPMLTENNNVTANDTTIKGNEEKVTNTIETWNDVHQMLMNTFKTEIEPQITKCFHQYQPDVPMNIITTILSFLTPKLQKVQASWHIESWIFNSFTLPINCSKHLGYPYLTKHENWPQCNQRKCCKRKLHLFLQINMNDLPTQFTKQYLPFSEQYKDYLFQLFHCLNPECMILFGEGYKSSSKVHLSRFIKFKENNQRDIEYLNQQMNIMKQEFEIRKSNPTQYDYYFSRFLFTEYKIVFPLKGDDSPYWAEYGRINSGIFSYKWPKKVEKFLDNQYPEYGNKVGGYFNWRQPDATYPICSICGFEMDVPFVQITGCGFGWQFTREGYGLMSICPNHPFEVAYQCTF